MADIWQTHPFYRALAPEAFALVRQRMRLICLQRGEILALEGESCGYLYWAAEGRLRVVKHSTAGREQTLTEAHPGEVLNLVSALDGGPLPATIIAATRASVWALERTILDELLTRYPELSRLFLRELAARLRTQTALAADLALHSVAERLARLMVNEAASPLGLHTTQRELASRLGTVREVLARELARFAERGWIKLGRGTIEILDPHALQKIANSEDV